MSALELLIMMNIREDYGTKIQVAIFHSCLALYISPFFSSVSTCYNPITYSLAIDSSSLINLLRILTRS